MTNPVANPKITQPWGKPNPRYKAKRHTGIDFGMPIGTDLFTVTNGKVVDVSFDKSYGNKVVIEYTHNGVKYQDWFCHITNAVVAKGAEVRAGDKIAVSGNTGNSTGPHLHLETRIAPFRYGNDVGHPVLGLQGIVHPDAPADRKPSIAQKVTAVVTPNKAPATKIVNLAELLRGDADDVQLVQSALNLKVTGKWDAATKSGYQKWQNSLGYKGKDADGMPGKTSLMKLGQKYGFKVI
jgi:murein DD-endopeptidase MepM/ murein hydrolase activator NlpD